MKWFRFGLQIVGAASLLALGIFAWMVYRDMTEHVNAAGNKDVLLVLNWGGLSTNQTIHLVGSYRSPRSFTGDHIDSYCIQLSKFELTDVAKEQWHEGPEANPILADALELAVNDAHDHAACFPTFAEANSSTMKMKFGTVVLHDRQATAAEIVLFDPKTKMLYYVSFKT